MRFKLLKPSIRSFGIAAAVLLLAVVFFVPSLDSSDSLQYAQNPLSHAAQAADQPLHWVITACLPKTSSDQTQGMLGLRLHPWLLIAWSLTLLLSFGLRIRKNEHYRPRFTRHVIVCVGTHAPPQPSAMA